MHIKPKHSHYLYYFGANFAKGAKLCIALLAYVNALLENYHEDLIWFKFCWGSQLSISLSTPSSGLKYTEHEVGRASTVFSPAHVIWQIRKNKCEHLSIPPKKKKVLESPLFKELASHIILPCALNSVGIFLSM